jgi:hypothetical protein
MNSATAAAAAATDSMRLGKLNSVVCTVTTIRRGLSEKPLRARTPGCFIYLRYFQEVRGCNMLTSCVSRKR